MHNFIKVNTVNDWDQIQWGLNTVNDWDQDTVGP